MSLENIITKIMDEAQSTIRVINDRAEEDLNKLEAELKGEEKELRDSAKKDAEAEGAEIIRRRISSASLEGRKRILGQKEKIIDEIFAEAKDRLLNFPDDDYIKLLTKFVTDSITTGDEVILLSDKDRSRLKDKIGSWEKEINKNLKEKGVSANVKVSDETRPISGGLVLVEGRTEINLSLDVLLAELRLSLESSLMQVLLGGKKG
jgi:V/A-type H+-transporting ATPase subunit E